MSEQSHEFLFELGTEELPPKNLPNLLEALASHVESSLQRLDIEFSGIRPYASPRRLAIIVSGLPSTTPIKAVKSWGPPARIAFDSDGNPTKAAEAFAKKNKVSVSDLKTENDGKIDKLVVESKVGGDLLTGLLPGLVKDALTALPIAKRMRWGASRIEFVRPVHWLCMLFDSVVIPCSILGLEASNKTRGHRFHCNKEIIIDSPSAYVDVLKKAYVIVDMQARKEVIRQQVEALGESLGGKSIIADDLLDEVTGLVEWPVALAGKFEQRFLSVPTEALISSMKEHQKYFHIVDDKDALLPAFITISNIESKDPSQVISGNEKVIRPRLSDADFFFTTDKKTSLVEHREKLKNVVFQAKLGTVYQKTERVAKLAKSIAQQLAMDEALALRAGQLSKADLVTNMVTEFSDMQGIAGYYYAVNDQEPNDVAQALKEQYKPKFAKDSLPGTETGSILALADRLDTLAGIFGIGQSPTGSKDPFGLRRASLAVLRILVEKQYNLDLRTLLVEAVGLYPELPKGSESAELALNYMLDRFRSWYEERNIPISVFQSVSAKSLTCPLDIDNRIHAVTAFYQMPEAAALAAANKRVSNILAKLETAPTSTVDSSLLQEAAEKDLANKVLALQTQVTPLFEAGKYKESLALLASLREPIDQFFDDVMVMAEDIALRNNRLALLQNLRNLFLDVADISFLVVSK